MVKDILANHSDSREDRTAFSRHVEAEGRARGDTMIVRRVMDALVLNIELAD